MKEPVKEVKEEVKEPTKEVEEAKEEVDEPTTGVEGSKAEVKETGKKIEGSKDAVNQSAVVQEQNVNNQVVKENKPAVNKQEESKKSLGSNRWTREYINITFRHSVSSFSTEYVCI